MASAARIRVAREFPQRHLHMENPLNFESVALTIFAGLVQKSHAYGSDDADRKKLANIACQYADALLAVLQSRTANAAVAKA